MIKLIATDLDGTLLTAKKDKPTDFEEVFNEMERRGITFVVASGRDYHGASMYFDGYKDRMMFVCDNGANIYKNGKLISAHTMPKEKYLRLLSKLKDLDIKDLLVCGTNGSYIQSESSPEYLSRMLNHYSPAKVVDDLSSIEDDIFKVSVTDLEGLTLREAVYEPLMATEIAEELTIHISGTRFLDTMDTTADKGVGIREIQEMLGITEEETMAFGDYYNDEPLLDAAGYAFIMQGAPDDLKEKYNYHAGSCDEDGVTKAIREWAFEKIK